MKQKQVDRYTVRLDAAIITVLTEPDELDRRMAERLPHIYSIDKDDMLVVGEVAFSYRKNATERYNRIKTSFDVIRLLEDYYL